MKNMLRTGLGVPLSLPRALLVTLALLHGGCFFDGDLKHDTGVVPEVLDDGWEIDTPENVGLSKQALAAIHRELLREDRYRGALSFLVVKDGKLVFETYLRDRADQRHFGHIQSMTKSVTSLVFGIASDRGDVPSLDLTVGELFPEKLTGLARQKARITLRHLLTMTSGLEFDNKHFSVEMWVEKPDDPLRYIFEKPLYADPGKKFYYRDLDPQLISYAVSELSGESEQELARKTLFGALDIEDYHWETSPDGVSLGAHGLHLLPRDLCKLGQLLLDRGAWRGEQVVSEAWIEEATQGQFRSDVEYRGGYFPYGYYFWVVPDVGFSMWGHGGQFVLVVPERNLVLVQTAFPDTDLGDDELSTFLALVAPLL